MEDYNALLIGKSSSLKYDRIKRLKNEILEKSIFYYNTKNLYNRYCITRIK